MAIFPEPRPYRTHADFIAMGRLLSQGRRSATATHYVHVGDLGWWLFYLNQDFALCDHCYLWDDPAGESPRGWALISPQYGAFDVFTRPDQWTSGAANAMFVWAETQMAERARPAARAHIRTLWVAEGDARLRSHLERRGFRRSDDSIIYTEQPLVDPARPSIPAGFTLRGTHGLAEAEARAMPQHAAFGSSLPFAAYWPRYRHLMQSPVYRSDLDVVAVTPDGRIVAFCLAWIDPTTRLGLLEPVGVDPDFQRRGLGRAVVQEALYRLHALGMTQACVGFEPDNAAARALYLGAGFQAQYQILSYELALSQGEAHA